MAIKMKGVLAVPGTFTRGDETYIKTAEELKDAAERYPILPLTFGHTKDHLPPTRAEQIGTVSQKWNEREQRVESEFWFHDEKVPDALRSLIDSGGKIPISAMYLVDSIDEDGTQHGMSYSHVAVLDSEDPVCPLSECGAFVRVESQTNGRHIFFEHATDLTPAEKKEPEAAPVPTPDEVKVEPEQPKPVAPVEQKPKEPDVAPVQEEVKLVPEVLIPAALATVKREFEVIDGKYVFVPQAFKQQQEKK